MTDQQRCPASMEAVSEQGGVCPLCDRPALAHDSEWTRNDSPEKLAAPNPGQDQLVVPDNVIDLAREAGADGYSLAEGGRRTREVAAEAAFARVVASWAREQGRAEGAAEERAIVKALVHRMGVQAENDHGDAARGGRQIMQTLYAGKKAGIDAALAALDREEPA